MSDLMHALPGHARRRPNTIAVVNGRRTLTYEELWTGGTPLIESLQRAGVARGVVVAVDLPRSIELVEAVVALQRLGAVYLPLHPSEPEARRASILRDSGSAALLDRGGVHPLAPEEIVTHPDAAYLMYTSGSTGRPKGVLHMQQALDELIAWQAADANSRGAERTALLSPIAFDVSVQEMLATLSSGGTLICIPETAKRDPTHLWRMLIGSGVRRIFLPFVLLHLLAEAAVDEDESLRHVSALRTVVVSGEQLVATPAVVRLFEGMPRCRLVNQYGPLETHVVTQHVLDARPSEWPMLPPIGQSVRAARIAIDDGRALSWHGEAEGELLVAGNCLAERYLGSTEESDARFIHREGVRLYRTGDRVQRDGRDCLRWVGRLDDQVKVNGYRIDPSEMEALILQDPGVRSAAVGLVGTGESRRFIAAVVTDDDDAPRRASRRIAAEYPSYAWPTEFRRVPDPRLTASGKTARRALLVEADEFTAITKEQE